MTTISAEQVMAMRETGRPVFIIDVRPDHYVVQSPEMIEGAIHRDAGRMGDWIDELPSDVPVVAVCAFGRSVGPEAAASLRAAGIDAYSMVGGHAAWKAAGGPTSQTTSSAT